jgi:mycothiol maleylpyruvate isomerase-like protein
MLFLDTSRVAHALIARAEVSDAWAGPSALERWSVAGLAGHLFRGTGSVGAYLDRPEPDEQPISAAAYYAAAVDSDDLDSELHQAIRARGEAEAAGGHAALVDKLGEQITALTVRLEAESPTRLVRVHKDLVLRLDDYLKTRLIELLVHIDDLAASVAIPTPDSPPGAATVAIETLVEVARYRHGDGDVLRALTRRERDVVQALRVL